MHEHEELTTDNARKFLSFRLGEEMFAFPVQRVWEIIDHTGVTGVPQTPPSMLGVINLRGGVVPVFDMHRRFGRSSTEQTVDTCIIIIDVNADGESVLVGAVADAVDEVIELDPDAIEGAPKLGTDINIDFISGMARTEGGFIMILDIDRLFSLDDVAAARETV